MSINLENSVNAAMPKPNRASQEEGVETMHQAPAKDEEIVRSYGKRNRKRLAEMTSPVHVSE